VGLFWNTKHTHTCLLTYLLALNPHGAPKNVNSSPAYDTITTELCTQNFGKWM